MLRPGRRVWLAIAVAIAFAGLTWLALAIVPSVRIDATPADGRAGLEVAADLPAATCRKTLTATFPWVRFSCEPRTDDESASGEDGDSAVPHDLDTPLDTE